MSQPSFIRPHANGVYLAVKLQPRASTNEICAALGDALKIKVTAPPVDAAANQSLADLLAEKLNCLRGKIQIVRGQPRATILFGSKKKQLIENTVSPMKTCVTTSYVN